MNRNVGDTIKRNYDQYVNRYPEEGMFSNQGESGLPLKDAIHSGKYHFFSGNTGMLERRYLIKHNDSIGPVEDLPIEVLEKLPIWLTNILQVQITEDHIDYWKFTVKSLEKLHDKNDTLERNILSKIQLLFSVSTIDEIKLPIMNSTFQEDRAPEIASFLCYPVLEGYLKRMCEDIAIDGSIQQADQVRKVGQNAHYDKDDTCSSLTDLLVHFEEEANSNLKQKLCLIRSEIAEFGDVNAANAYGLIYSWRNSLSHGQLIPDVQYGLILNIISLLIWDEIGAMWDS